MEKNHFKLKSLLCIPLNKDKLFKSKYYKKIISKSDGIILDLQDGVKLNQKDLARNILKQTIDEFKILNPNIIVRINDLGTKLYEEDMNIILKNDILKDVISIQPTNVENKNDIIKLKTLLGNKLSIVIETPMGVRNSDALCDLLPSSVFIGVQDLASHMNVKPSKDNMHFSASKIIMSASTHNIPVYGTIGDFSIFDKNQQKYKELLMFSKDLGITGSYAMTEYQVNIINEVFKLSLSEREEYINVLKNAKINKNSIFTYKNIMYGPPMLRMIKKRLEND